MAVVINGQQATDRSHGEVVGSPKAAIFLAQQRPTGRSHGEAMAAIGQGDLCGTVLVAGLACCEHLMAGPSPIWNMQRGFLRQKRRRRRRRSGGGGGGGDGSGGGGGGGAAALALEAWV
jgi:hypothetical protein